MVAKVSCFVVSFAGCAVELLHPPGWEQDLRLLFGESIAPGVAPLSRLSLTSTDGAACSIFDDGVPILEGLSRPDALHRLSGIVVGKLASHVETGVSLHAGAVAWNGKSLLIAGASGAGKSSLTAWFVENGFSYVTDEFVLLKQGAALTGFSRALMLKPGASEIVSAFPRLSDSTRRQFGAALMIRPSAFPTDDQLPCGLIVFPEFHPEYDLTIEAIRPAKTSIALLAYTGNTHKLADGGFGSLNELALRAPAIVVRYGAFSQIDGVIDALARFLLDGRLDNAGTRRFLAGINAPEKEVHRPKTVREIPSATPRKQDARLTIGMATYDDYDGVYFSVQALRLYHPELADECEFLVIDNNPKGDCAEPLKDLERHIPNYRYIPEPARIGTSVRDMVFKEAAGEFVLCIDCHVFIVQGAIKRLLKYLSDNRTTQDLLQGPLLRDDLKSISTHFRPEWRGGMYGVWDDNGAASDPEAPPFDIEMQGLGLFACRRDAWPGFNPAFRGFGGEEGYIHEKFRRAGARTLCLPFLRWMHRFGRPMGTSYPNLWEDRIWNYLVGFSELGLPTEEMERHFRQLLGEPRGAEVFERLKRIAKNAPSSARTHFVRS